MVRYWNRRAGRKISVYATLALGVVFFAIACSRDYAGRTDEIIANVQEAYAPDKRTVLFTASAENRGGKIIVSGETSSLPAKRALFALLDSAGLDVTDSVRLLPGDDVGMERFAIARLSVCNLRVAPGHSEEMATQVLLGTPLRILRDQGSWLQVQTPEDYIAWTQGSGLVRMDSTRFASWRSRPRLMFTADFGQAFAAPGIKATDVVAQGGRETVASVGDPGAVVSDLVIGDILALNGEDGDFYRVVFPDGRKALVRKDQAMPLTEWMRGLEPSGENILLVARQMMGAPYLWGGTSSKGVDCRSEERW